MFATDGAVIAGHPVDAGDDTGERAGAAAVEDPHCDERDLLGDAVRRAAGGASDVRAVTVAVGRQAAIDGVDA